MTLKYRRGVFLVVYSRIEGRIKYLILKRKLHWKGWEFPKGGIKHNENISNAVRRELKEETGGNPLKINNFDIKGKYKYKKLLKDRPGFFGQNYVLYSAEVKYGKIKLDKIEHSGYEWLDFKDAIKKLTWKNQKKCLKIVNKWLIKENRR